MRLIIDICGAEKILFGSDGPIFEPISPVKEWVETLKYLPNNSELYSLKFSLTHVTAAYG
jgi:predicted TIM-barrel fold metal-dependent hydrolase